MNNELDKFQSHSVQYLMLAARSTESVRAFTDEQQRLSSLSAIDNAGALGDKITVPTGDAFLLIDTRRFSQYLVQDFELETIMAGFSVPGSQTPNSTAVNMKFTVLDSSGIGFANFLQHLMDQKLQVSFDGLTVLVRILFVGHLEDGTTEVVQSISIPAIFKQIELDLNGVKGVYSCTLLPLTGMASNAAYNPRWTSIGTASSFFTGPAANTLGAVVNAFERNLNAESIKRYTQLNAQTQNNGVKQTAGRFGRPVLYMITLPKDWQKFKFAGSGQGSAVETVFKELVKREDKTRTVAQAQQQAQANTTAVAKDSFVAVDPGLTVTEVLDVIFSQCLEVAKLGNFTKKQERDGSVRFYKHLVTVTSDDESYVVHVDVVEFAVPNVDLGTSSGSVTTDDALYELKTYPDGSTKRTPVQYLEYDYIFSGRNIDVLSLDLKIENLNYLLQQGSKLGQGELLVKAANAQDQSDGESVVSDEHPVYGRRKKDPALLPVRSYADRTNYSHLAANAQTGDSTPQAISQQYTQNLQAFYASGPVEAKLELRGNPGLMANVSLQTIPSHKNAVTITNTGGMTSKIDSGVKEQYREEFERAIVSNQRWSHVSSPVFLKVNVYAPNIDYMTGAAIPGAANQKFFHENFYFLDKIVSKIDASAKFTQELSLRSFSLFSFPNTDAKGANSSTVKEK